MAICATPGCGNPGRPFPACGMCRGRLYCGSPCLKPVKQYLVSEMNGTTRDADSAENDDTTVDICPICMELFLRQFPPVEVENTDDDA